MITASQPKAERAAPKVNDFLTFTPETKARWMLTRLKPEALEKGRVDCGDTMGTMKLHPGDVLRVRCLLSADALICEHSRNLLLVLIADTKPDTITR